MQDKVIKLYSSTHNDLDASFLKFNSLPVVALRDEVFFPNMVLPVMVGRKTSVKAIEEGIDQYNGYVFLAFQFDKSIDIPSQADLNPVGIVAKVLQFSLIDKDTYEVLLEGKSRAILSSIDLLQDISYSKFINIKEFIDKKKEKDFLFRLKSIVQELLNHPDYALVVSKRDRENLKAYQELLKLSFALPLILKLSKEEQLELIKQDTSESYIDYLILVIEQQLALAQYKEKIKAEVNKNIQKSQKNFYLNEQLKVIKKELGDDKEAEIKEILDRAEKNQLSEEAMVIVKKELSRLEKIPSMSPEAGVIRSYLESLIDLPWNRFSEDHINIGQVRSLLNSDHYGLELPKKRILEYLSVVKLKQNGKAPVLCLVGPPGTGKSSLARSIAKALNKKFVKISLGGVQDEAVIRGHRRTYIGAMPGRIIGALKKAGTKNPLVLLDEIDKLGYDFRGDPASALLEVLDTEQNYLFLDHYLDTEFDLSFIFFIATANDISKIPLVLRDRMEVIHIPSYTDEEKYHIAKQYLLPKALKEAGLDKLLLTMSKEIVLNIIHSYTREAGVRSLEKQLLQLCRSITHAIVEEKQSKIPKRLSITDKKLADMLGTPKYRKKSAHKIAKVGLVNGLAWTEVGGEVLTIEVVQTSGKGELILTGKLGEVMQESAKTAFTFVKSLKDSFAKGLETKNVHIHVPEGATPKDGPSAGVSIATALVSLLENRPVRSDIAMTGEVTLQGNILAIGGLKEKILGALRADIDEIIIPEDNRSSLSEIPDYIKDQVTIHTVSSMEELLGIAMVQ